MVMSVFEKVRELSSFNKCKEETIEREELGKILEAARRTPSPGNVQGLEFIVVESESELEKLADVASDDRVEEASAAVIIVGDLERMRKSFGDQALELCSSEAGAASQNMRLVAEELGLSSIWLTGLDDSAGEAFGVPGERTVSGVAAFGYTDNPVPLDPKFGLESVVYYERYGNKVSSIFDSWDWKGIDAEMEAFERKSEKLLDKFRRRLEQIL